MAMNLNALLEDDGPKNTSSGTGLNWLKIERPAGDYHDYELRVLPPKGEQDLPYHHARLHYFKINGKLSVGAVQGDDPAAKLYWKHKDNPKVKDDPAVNNTLRGLKPADKYYYNVVDRSDGQVKVASLPWSAHEMIKKELINYLKDDLDITDPETGFDIVLTVEPANVFGRNSHKYKSVSVRPKAKPIGVDGWEDKMATLEEECVTSFFTPEEVEDIIPEVLGDFHTLITSL